jgi:hypothetical protein
MNMPRLYWLASSFGILGFVWFLLLPDPASAFGFLIGAAGSSGNLWLFDWLSRTIAPGERTQKPWTASLFVGRYLVLWFTGYVIVKLLSVQPFAIVLGLLTSTAAVLASLLLEVLQGLFRRKVTH